MKQAMPMVLLTSVAGQFHAKVIVARLGAEGVLADLRGSVDGPYPIFTEVDVYVRADQASIAREILLADAVDAALEPALRQDWDESAGADYGYATDEYRTTRLPVRAHSRRLTLTSIVACGLVATLVAVAWIVATAYR